MEGTKQQSLKRALEKEEDKKSFYLKAASGAKSLFAKRMFEELAGEENVHGKRVLEIYEALKKDAAFRQWTNTARGPSRIEAVFQEVSPDKSEECADDLCALQTGLEMASKSPKRIERPYDSIFLKAELWLLRAPSLYSSDSSPTTAPPDGIFL